MFVYVKLLSGFPKTLVYKVPESLSHQNFINTLVQVPLREKKVTAFVISQVIKPTEKVAFVIKEIIGPKPFPADNDFHDFVSKSAHFYFTSTLYFYQKLRQFLKKREETELPQTPPPLLLHTPPTLTEEQTAAAEYLKGAITAQKFTPMVLHGVTGSGKTEVYKAAITHATQLNKSVIFLLPEVSLATQFQRILQASLPNSVIYSFHSGSSQVEKKIVWRALINSQPIVVVGVHLPILLPIANLGLIIIDEEHEAGFEEKNHPKFNSKYLALIRAQTYGIPIVLGSATPSVHTLYNVQAKGWQLFKLTKRFAGAFPTIHIVVLPLQPKKRASFWISRDLEKAIASCLEQKKQAIIFLNRRGYSFFMQCKACGFVFECPSCSVSLTAHRHDEGNLRLQCHYCSYTRSIPTICEGCKLGSDQFLTKGIGTQQLVEILQRLFPSARIARADLDVTSKKKLWQETAAQFQRGDLDILVGTKSITKGYHFPGVTLVGVVWGDLHAHIPVFNAGEQCLQQLIQVAGRAGREYPESTVIVQIMHEHDMFKFINEIDYLSFAEQELEERKASNYPPFCRLAQIELKHKSAAQVSLDAQAVSQLLHQHNQNPDTVHILGPATPVIHKVQNVEARHIFIKAERFNDIERLIKAVDTQKLKSRFYVQII